MDRKQTGSPGVTTGFRFPRRHRRFPSEGSRSGYTAEGFPFLLPRLRQDWRGPARSLGPRRFWKEWQAQTGGAELEPGEGPLPSSTRARPGPAGAGLLSVAHREGERLSRGAGREDEQHAAGKPAHAVHSLGAGASLAYRNSDPRDLGGSW